ncbi:MAG: TIM barrel protein [Verrucomicrobiae bacterium]|nr:TIM barrel protein [Verrucomicrobiae bacterium]
MKKPHLLTGALTVLFFSLPGWAVSETPENFEKENLVAWCIVPFDATKRSPAERAAMLEEIGLKRCAYDWRQEHVPTFEQEILEYRKHGIEYFAFWGQHEEAFKLFEKYDLHPQIWMTLRPGKGETEAEMIAGAADQLEPLAKRCAALGCQLGLYNHGGWGGEPENLVAVCREMRKRGHEHVGIVYNFHHAHDRIDDWEKVFPLMKPYLLCLNLDGMVKGGDKKGKMILPLGQGDEELGMIRFVIRSGYKGPIGILDHRNDTDTALALRDNLDGLAWLLKEIEKPGSGGEKPTPRAP